MKRWRLLPRPRLVSRTRRKCPLGLERLEDRTVPSVDLLTQGPGLPSNNSDPSAGTIQPPAATSPATPVAQTFHTVNALYGPGQTPGGYWPSQIRHAYGFDQLSLNGAGQTIAIVDAYADPNMANDLAAFDTQFGLPAPPSFTQVSQTGGPSSSVPTDSSGGWEVEEALDVEWAHAIAPSANILLVEANSANLGDLLTAVQYATSQPNVDVVSMSWGGSEFTGQSSYDSYFTTPAGHKGITFVAASGDYGTPAGWPATSPNVLAVGGTTLSLNASDNRTGETGWSSSGGGYSSVYGTPSYQQTYANSSYVQNTLNNKVLLAGIRGNPDVSYNADSSPGYAVYDSFPYQGTSYTWFSVGGTSAGAPQWSALIALADQARGASGSLDGPSQTLPDLYNLAANPTTYSRDFYDVTSGSNGDSAQTGYDLVTGLGSPQANNLIPDLTGSAASTIYFTVSAPTTSTAGSPFSVTVTAHNANGTVDTGYVGTVHFTSSDGQAVLPSNTTFTGANQGTMTLSGVDLKTAGNETVTATDTTSGVTGNASVDVTPAGAVALTVTGFPSPVNAGTSGTFTVTARDPYGNIATSDSGSVTFSSSDPKAVLPSNATLTNGTGTYSATFLTPGTQSLTARDAAGDTGTESGIQVNTAPSSLTFASTDVPATLLGGYETVSTLNVPTNLDITKLTVKLNLTIPNTGTLAIDLVSPNGTDVSLSYFEGYGSNFNNTVFDDAATTPIYLGNSPFAGSYQPETPLSAVNGTNAAGTWYLVVQDWGYRSGRINSWSLTFQGSTTSPAFTVNDTSTGTPLSPGLTPLPTRMTVSLPATGPASSATVVSIFAPATAATTSVADISASSPATPVPGLDNGTGVMIVHALTGSPGAVVGLSASSPSTGVNGATVNVLVQGPLALRGATTALSSSGQTNADEGDDPSGMLPDVPGLPPMVGPEVATSALLYGATDKPAGAAAEGELTAPVCDAVFAGEPGLAFLTDQGLEVGVTPLSTLSENGPSAALVLALALGGFWRGDAADPQQPFEKRRAAGI